MLLTVSNGSLDEDPLFIPVAVMMIVGYTVTGAILASRQPTNAIGWLLLAVGVLFLLVGLSDEYMQWVYRDGPSDAPLGPVVGLITSVLWLPMIAIVSLLLLLFPNGSVPGPRWRFLPLIIGSSIALFLIGSVLAPGPLEDTGLEGVVIDNPAGVEALEAVTSVAVALASVVTLVCILPCVAALVVRFVRSRGEERQQVKWLAYVAAATIVLVILQIASSIAIGDAYAGSLLDQFLFLSSFALIGVGVPVAMGVAVLRYRLYDLDLVVKKTIVFATLVVLVMLASLAVLVVIGSTFTDLTREELQTVGLAMFLVGVSVWPLWRFARWLADRVVYGGRATPYEVLTEFGQRVGETYSADDVLPRMAQLLGEATGASSAHVWIRVGDGFRRVASSPPDADAPAPGGGASGSNDATDRTRGEAEVRDRGEVLGALSVEMPASDPMSPAKDRIVRDLAAQTGLLLRNVQLIEELRESRRRIVSAQDDRAKKLERDIHDGAQQQLVALSVKARLARTLTSRDPGKAAEMLEQIEAETQAALEDLRDLARGIYPPLLADRGLVEALGAQARKASLPVTIEPDGLGRYSPEVEAGLYFCVLEALQNVAKYADAGSVRVRLGAAGGDVLFEVVDDGRGFDTARTKLGTGLQGIADRLSALGGEVSIASQPGRGTTISGRVPTMSS
jgi:signal transduction histidine kinase